MIDNRSPIQKSISWLLVGLIALFALASLGNVAEFIRQYHHGWTGWVLGGCFAITVFVCAYLAATAQSRATRVWALIVAFIFGVSSGFFQAWLYADGGAPWLVAGLLSFVPIVVGEVGLALVESSYSREKVGQQPVISQTEFDDLEQRLTDSEQSRTKVEQELETVRQEFDELRQRWESVEQGQETKRAEFDALQTKFDQLQTKHNQLRKEFDAFAPSSVLGRLNDTQRQKIDELLRLVSEQRVEAPGDLIKLGMSKSDVYALWPVVSASLLAYPNGDGAYHVRN